MGEQPDLVPYFESIADGQARMVDAIETQSMASPTQAAETEDAEARMRLRSIDVQLLRILEEMSAGRQETMAELRSDINALTKAIRALGGQ